MSIKEAIVNNIVEGISTKEPLYKITYILPNLEINDDDDDEEKYYVHCDRKTVIWNKSTYMENMIDSCKEFVERCWNEVIDKNNHHHYINRFGYRTKNDTNIMVYKLSVELIN